MFGMDTRTPEGAAAFKAEYETLCELAPEIIKKEDMVMPHEQPPRLPDEPHFQRVWQHYREYTFKLRFAEKVEAGIISEEDAANFTRFVGSVNHPTFSLFILAKAGKLTHLERDEGYQSTMRVLDAMDLKDIQFNPHTTSMPVEEQFWHQYDGFYQLTEKSMRKELPHFITDPANLAKVEAMIESGDGAEGLTAEETRQIA